MNISHFEQYISSTILDRGYQYYMDGNIKEIDSQSANEYIFYIQGSENYEVIVKIDDLGEILFSSCNCPYDFGPVCKHEVAAYFKLYEILNNKKYHIDAAIDLDFKEVLNKLSKEVLVNIIMNIADKDESIRNSIILKYADGDVNQKLRKCKNFIDCVVKKYKGREGFISYRETDSFILEMEDLLEKISVEYEVNHNPLLALDIAFMVLEEAIEAFQYADDSNGDIGGFVFQVLELINKIADNYQDAQINLREKMFQKLIKESENSVFDDWDDFRIAILNICTGFADIEAFRNKLTEKIQYFLINNNHDEYKRYSNEKMLEILYKIIHQYGRKEEMEKFIYKNLQFPTFRRILIERLTEEKNYHKVIEVALEGEKKDHLYPGLVYQWMEMRYIAYKKLSLREEQEKLAKTLLFAGDFKYYKELEELYQHDVNGFYLHIKKELKSHKRWHTRNIYLKLIVMKKDFSEMLEVAMEDPRMIEEYADHLLDEHKNEVIEIYKKHIKTQASLASNRKQYQQICRIINKYKKIAGSEHQKDLVNELVFMYKKRPAFIDELSKAK